MSYKNTQSGFASILIAVIAVILIGGGILYFKTPALTPKEDLKPAIVSVPAENNIPAQETETAAKAGTFEPYAPEKIEKASTGKVVLFFHASWCTTCRALTEDIKAHLDAIPENVTILDVDYDNSSELKQKYKVTTQHTLVQVDAKGDQIKQWKGSMTLADFLTNLQ